MKTLFFLLFAVAPFFLKAQIGMGTWKLHVATSKAIDVVASEKEVFAAYVNGLSVYDIDTEEHRLLTALNGLSDIEISCLFYDEVQDAVYIGYKNGNIDSGSVTLAAGNYVLFCTVPGHQNMKADLTVK
mgnify:CR=1 FL=1